MMSSSAASSSSNLMVKGNESSPVRAAYILVACLQNMLCGGIFFGWSSISSTLLVASTEEGGPGLQIDYIQYIYVLAIFANSMGPLFLGIILDSYGPRACSIVSTSIIALGSLLFAVSNMQDFNYFSIAMCMISFGGSGVQSAIIHLSNLFPIWKASMTATITGCFQLSFLVFLIFESLWRDFGFSCSQLFIGYSGACVVSAIIAFFIWPDTPLDYDQQMSILHPSDGDGTQDRGLDLTQYRLPSGMLKSSEIMMSYGSQVNSASSPNRREVSNFFYDGKDDTSNSVNNGNHNEHIIGADDIRAVNVIANEMVHLTHIDEWCKESACVDHGEVLDPIVLSLEQHLTSKVFIRLNIMFCIFSFWANFYVGTATTQLGDMMIVPSAQMSEYGEKLTLLMTAGVVFIPVVGWLMDACGYPITMLCTIVFAIVWAFFLCLENSTYIYPSFVVYALFRTFLFTFLFSYMADRLGFKFFGILVGILFAIAGFVGLLQYPVSAYAFGDCITNPGPDCSKGQWNTLNHIMLYSFIPLLFFPYQDYIERKEKAWRFQSIYGHISSSASDADLAGLNQGTNLL